ncbi:MAG: carboxymuconolactone decarboxylase family protein [Bdellovibrionales bacterium]|nr:carboxymuconolactone decarboxylase family protein [Ramlibacter sp.]
MKADFGAPTNASTPHSPLGHETRRIIVGDDYVNTALQSTPFDAEWQAYLNNQLWARTWARGIISHQEYSLINLAMLAGLGRMEEFELHFKIAITRTKPPLEKIRELLLHIGMYCGIPVGRDCFVIARRLLKEHKIDLSVLEEGKGLAKSKSKAAAKPGKSALRAPAKTSTKKKSSGKTSK